MDAQRESLKEVVQSLEAVLGASGLQELRNLAADFGSSFSRLITWRPSGTDTSCAGPPACENGDLQILYRL